MSFYALQTISYSCLCEIKRGPAVRGPRKVRAGGMASAAYALNADVKENSIREATQILGDNGSDTGQSVNTAGATGSGTLSSVTGSTPPTVAPTVTNLITTVTSTTTTITVTYGPLNGL